VVNTIQVWAPGRLTYRRENPVKDTLPDKGAGRSQTLHLEPVATVRAFLTVGFAMAHISSVRVPINLNSARSPFAFSNAKFQLTDDHPNDYGQERTGREFIPRPLAFIRMMQL